MQIFIGGRRIVWVLSLLLAVVPIGRLAAEESMHSVQQALGSTTLSGYVDTSVSWNTQTAVPAIPEPSSLALAALLAGALLCARRRRTHR